MFLRLATVAFARFRGFLISFDFSGVFCMKLILLSTGLHFQVLDSCSGATDCVSGLYCGNCPAAGRSQPVCTRGQATIPTSITIKNDDLEEIQELGSRTYGSVYHDKWKGSDVAIKRIKASCFAGKPSERERLIADFWKEP